MRLCYRATAICEHSDPTTGRECTETGTYEEWNPEGTTPEGFGDDARRHFRAAGWIVDAPGNGPHVLCPRHAV